MWEIDLVFVRNSFTDGCSIFIRFFSKVSCAHSQDNRSSVLIHSCLHLPHLRVICRNLELYEGYENLPIVWKSEMYNYMSRRSLLSYTSYLFPAALSRSPIQLLCLVDSNQSVLNLTPLHGDFEIMNNLLGVHSDPVDPLLSTFAPKGLLVSIAEKAPNLRKLSLSFIHADHEQGLLDLKVWIKIAAISLFDSHLHPWRNSQSSPTNPKFSTIYLFHSPRNLFT